MRKPLKIALLTTDGRSLSPRWHGTLPSFGTAPTALLEGLSQIDDVEVHVISCSPTEFSSPSKLGNNIWFHQPIVGRWGWGRSAFFGCTLAVRRKLNEIAPDIVHGQGTERDCALSAVLSGYPNVVTIHGNMRAIARLRQAKTISYHGMVAALESFAIRRTAGVFCNSAYTESEISPLAKKTWRVPNAIRTEFLAATPHLTTKQRRIVVVGSIVYYKQPLEILQAWMNLKNLTDDVMLTFVGQCGDDTYSRKFRTLLEHPNLAGRAEHVDWLNLTDLIRLLNSAKGMIHFPIEEAFGLVVAEGLACNLKLFAASTGGVPDVAANCTDSEFYAPDDWEGLSQGICCWLDQDMPTSETRHIIAARFSPRSIAQQHLEIYREVLTRLTAPCRVSI